MDFLILFHVENNTKLINQFRSFIKRNYDNQNINELIDQIKSFFEYIDSDNILYIHKKDYSDRVNISKWEILEIIEDAKFNNFESLRSEEHTSELQSRPHLVCRLLLE